MNQLLSSKVWLARSQPVWLLYEAAFIYTQSSIGFYRKVVTNTHSDLTVVEVKGPAEYFIMDDDVQQQPPFFSLICLPPEVVLSLADWVSKEISSYSELIDSDRE